MLKFLTHKLRTHSLNEESVAEKVEERDSGTESDDEADRPDRGDFCTDVIMKWNDDVTTDLDGESAGAACACAPVAPAARLPPPPEPDLLYDHHSSEEELEVETPVRFRTSPPLEALKPRRAGGAVPPGGAGGGGGGGPCLCARADMRADSRRRRVVQPPRRHRPALDFDKMQQLKVGAGHGHAGSSAGGVRSWRAVGAAHTGELSVFCW